MMSLQEQEPGLSPKMVPFRIVAFGRDVSAVRAIGRSLEDEPAIQVILNTKAISTVRESQLLPDYHVALVDIDAGQTSTYAMINILLSSSTNRPVIGITNTSHLEPIWHAINAGASGVIHQRDFDSKSFPAEFPSHDGSKAYLSPSVAKILLEQIKVEPVNSQPVAPDDSSIESLPTVACAAARPALSPRECEILKLSAGGHIGKDIAQLLSVSPHTITSHFKNIYRKLKVNTRGEAVFRAHSAGLI